VVRYRRLNRKDPRLEVFGTQFCAECPDVDDIPAACEASCDPGLQRFGACRLTARCPCAREDSEARKRAFAIWLMTRLEAVRLRERAQQGDAADGHTATVWRALAQLLLDAVGAEEQHRALGRWSAAVLAGGGEGESRRLAELLRESPARGEAAELPMQAALNNRQQWALHRAQICNQVDSMDIARQFGVSRELGRRDLAMLAQLGLLVRRGAGKGTVYAPAK